MVGGVGGYNPNRFAFPAQVASSNNAFAPSPFGNTSSSPMTSFMPLFMALMASKRKGRKKNKSRNGKGAKAVTSGLNLASQIMAMAKAGAKAGGSSGSGGSGGGSGGGAKTGGGGSCGGSASTGSKSSCGSPTGAKGTGGNNCSGGVCKPTDAKGSTTQGTQPGSSVGAKTPAEKTDNIVRTFRTPDGKTVGNLTESQAAKNVATLQGQSAGTWTKAFMDGKITIDQLQQGRVAAAERELSAAKLSADPTRIQEAERNLTAARSSQAAADSRSPMNPATRTGGSGSSIQTSAINGANNVSSAIGAGTSGTEALNSFLRDVGASDNTSQVSFLTDGDDSLDGEDGEERVSYDGSEGDQLASLEGSEGSEGSEFISDESGGDSLAMGDSGGGMDFEAPMMDGGGMASMA